MSVNHPTPPAPTPPTSTAPQFRLVTSSSLNTELVAYINRGGSYWTTHFDVDGDGQYEILGTNDDGTIRYYDRNASGEWITNTTEFAGIDVDSYSAPQMIMLNGKAHLVVGSSNGFHTYTKNSNGIWVEQTGANNPFGHINTGSYSAPGFADIDGDGRLDFVAAGASTIHFYYQNESNQWVKQNYSYNVGGSYSFVGMGDYDGDGDIDMIASGGGNQLHYVQRDGDSWTRLQGADDPFNSASRSYWAAVSSFDLDNDGDLDVIIDRQVYENLLYSPDDAVKVIRHASQQIDMADAQSNTINLNDYFSNTETGDLTYTIADQPDFATLNDNIITLRSNNSDDLGVHSLQVTASNGSFSTKQAININVTNIGIVNQAPVARILGVLKYDTQDSWVVDLNEFFTDPDGDDLTFEVTGLPVFATYTVNDEEITFTTNNTATGVYSANITATDAFGASAAEPYKFEIIEENDKPILNGLAQTSFTIDELAHPSQARDGVFLPSLFRDEERNPLSYSVNDDDLPAGFIFNKVYGGFYLVGTTKEFDGDVFIEVTATEIGTTETYSVSSTLTFTVNADTIINDTPTATTAASSETITEDTAFSFNSVSRFGFNDEESGTALTYSISGDDLPEGFEIDASTGDLSALDTVTDHDALGASGTAIITVTASDGNSHISSALTLTMEHVNDTPTAQTARITRTLDQNTLLSFNIQDEFGFADEEAESLELSLSGTTHFAISENGAELETYNKEKTLSNDLVGTHTFTLSARDSGKSTPNGEASVNDIKSVDGTVILTIVNVNDAPELRPADVRPTYKLGAYINEQIVIDFSKHFKDIDFIHSEAGEALTFTLTAGNEKTRAFFQTIDGVEKPDVNDPTADQNIFTLTDKMLSAGDNAFLTLSPNDAATGDLLFSVKAQDESDIFSDSLDFQLDVKNAYLWERGNEKLNITATNQDADARSEITATIGDDDKFSHFTWERSGDSLTIRLVLGEGEQQTSETIATINNIFSTRGPESVAVRKGDQNIALLYLNTGENLDNSVDAFSVYTSDIDPVSSYTEIILPYQTGSNAVTVTQSDPDPNLVDSANVQYHIYGSDGNAGHIDELHGGNGDDFFYAGRGSHDIYGEGGSDTVVYEGFGTDLTVNLNELPSRMGTYRDILAGIENIKIIGGADTNSNLVGTAEANQIEGGNGSDTIDGMLGRDNLIGNAGDDIFMAYGTEVAIDGGAGSDTLKLTSTSIQYLPKFADRYSSLEIIDLTEADTAFKVTLDQDTIKKSFEGSVTVEGASDDIIYLKGWAEGHWTEVEAEEGYKQYSYDGATIIINENITEIQEPPESIRHKTILIDSSGGKFKFVSDVEILDFNPNRDDKLIFQDMNEGTDRVDSVEELARALTDWIEFRGGISFSSGNTRSEAQYLEIFPTDDSSFLKVQEKEADEKFDEATWHSVVDALGGVDAFEFM